MICVKRKYVSHVECAKITTDDHHLIQKNPAITCNSCLESAKKVVLPDQQ